MHHHFRDEEELITAIKQAGGDTWDFYKNKIYPFKGAVEQWYQNHQSFAVDFKIIVITAWVILNAKSNLVYKAFQSLPQREF